MSSDMEDSDGSLSSLEDPSSDLESRGGSSSSVEDPSSDLESSDGYCSYVDEDGVHFSKKYVRVCILSRTAADAAAAEENSQVVQLEDRLWSSLPPELIGKILRWLPPAAHFRFRGICKRWGSLLTSPGWLHHYAEAQPLPACPVMTPSVSQLPHFFCHFFCHSEQKWYKLPMSFLIPSGWQTGFTPMDTDMGLVCCSSYRDLNMGGNGRTGFCVCNPLTKASKILLTPCYPQNWAGQGRHGLFRFVKLHVDRQTKNFKVVLLAEYSNPPTTIMYDSAVSRWSICGSYPSRNYLYGFVRKNVLYQYNAFNKFWAPMVAFDMDTGLWSDVEIELPGPWAPEKCFIVCHNDRVLFVRKDPAAEEPICIWKLRDDATNFSDCSWIKVPVDVPSTIKPLLEALNRCMYQGDWIFFYGRTNRWFKYTFATRCWRVMPILAYRGLEFAKWFNWEPRLDVNVESDPLQNEESDDKSDFLWGL